MKKIAIIGYGYVGKAMERYFADHYELVIQDPFQGFDNKDKVNECDLAVISVPTKMNDDGTCDVSIVEDVFTWLTVPLVLIKSTILPGTTKKLQAKYPNKQIVFSPEYVGEGKYQVQWWKDKAYPHPTEMKLHDFFIFGGERQARSKVLQFFKKVTGPDPKYVQTDSTTAELCKYMENSWNGTKVIFCNEFFDVAKSFGVDYDELRELFLLDGRVERMHTAVFEDKRGFGGKCLPKDINGIVKAAEGAGYQPTLLKAVLKSNEKFQA